MYVDVRVECLETVETGQQPFGGKRWRDADAENAGFTERVDGIHCRCQLRKANLQVTQAGSTSVRQDEAPAIARKDGQANVILKQANLVADGGRCDVEFLGGQSNAQMASGSLKRPEGIQWWQVAFHKYPILYQYSIVKGLAWP